MKLLVYYVYNYNFLLDVADLPSGAQSGGHARLNVEILAVKYLEGIFTVSSLRKTYGKIADSSDR